MDYCDDHIQVKVEPGSPAPSFAMGVESEESLVTSHLPCPCTSESSGYSSVPTASPESEDGAPQASTAPEPPSSRNDTPEVPDLNFNFPLCHCYYYVLGLRVEQVSQDAVLAAFREAMISLHPATCSLPNSTRETDLLCHAFEVVMANLRGEFNWVQDFNSHSCADYHRLAYQIWYEQTVAWEQRPELSMRVSDYRATMRDSISRAMS